MARIWIGVTLLAFVISGVSSAFNESICTLITENQGLFPPVLPTNFELKGERINNLYNFTQYEEMYFDYTNSRAKYMVLIDGVEIHKIFDYKTLQVLSYFTRNPGSSLKYDPVSFRCTSINMEDDQEVNDLFGYQDLEKPRMYTSSQVLRFGGPYQYAYQNSFVLPDRGISVNEFTGCLYDKTADLTMKTNYSFSGLKVAPSGGTLEQVVSGIEGLGLLSVPVTMYMTGLETDADGDADKFEMTMNVAWFQGEPVFKRGTFQIPPLMFCDGYRGNKEKTNFPNAFSTRIQNTTFTVDSYGNLTTKETTNFDQVYYYLEKKLARRDYTPTKKDDSKIYENFQSLDTVKTVWDFSEGLVYTTHKPTGKCFIEPIKPRTYFDRSPGNLFLLMASPEEIFDMTTKWKEYKGTDYIRDIECDVWTGKTFDKESNETMIKEIYFSTNGWHEEVEEQVKYASPVQNAVVTADSKGEKVKRVNEISFLKFKAQPPRLVTFDVSNCIEREEHQHLAIDLNLSEQNKKLLFDYKFQFLETAQYYIARESDVVTPLRVQKLQLRRLSAENPRVFLVFILVEKINLDGNLIVGQTGASLLEAIHNLQRLIDQNGFAIEFVHPSSEEGKVTEMTLITAEPSSLYNLTSNGTLQGPIKIRPAERTEEQVINVYEEPIIQTADEDQTATVEVEVKGMSPGALAALSFAMLFIGAGIGIASMYLYLRKFGSQMVDDRIAMSNRPTTSI